MGTPNDDTANGAFVFEQHVVTDAATR